MDNKANVEIQNIHVMELAFAYPESFNDYLFETIKSSVYYILYSIAYGKVPIEFMSRNKKHFWSHERNILYSKLRPIDE